jgi:hypothetical protein
MVEEFISADGGDFWEICWRSADGFSVDTGDIFLAGVFVEAYGEFVVADSAVFGNGVIYCGDRAARSATCGVCVEIEGESIRSVGHLILHSGGDSLLCGVDGFDVEIFARVGDLEGAGISSGDGGKRIEIHGNDHTENRIFSIARL